MSVYYVSIAPMEPDEDLGSPHSGPHELKLQMGITYIGAGK